MALPRPEHPRPDFYRSDWLNLNGTWQFEFDPGASGHVQDWAAGGKRFGKEIVVPFCMESPLSGVGYTDFMPAVWYRRTFAVPASWSGKHVLLTIGACDYQTTVFVNGRRAGRHFGTFTPTRLDITPFLRDGENELTIQAIDDLRSRKQPGGKQCFDYASRGCHYTRTTGIWQTVYIEAVPATWIDGIRILPDLDNRQAVIEVRPAGIAARGQLTAAVTATGQTVATASAHIHGQAARLTISLPDVVAWQVGKPFLYDVQLTLATPAGCDVVSTYFGMRKVHIEGTAIYFNNEPFFMRTVLDQGFYPDGVWTAPSDDALKKDIELAMAVGLNGARLHQKLFEPRFLYWADQLGYVVWGEIGDWGVRLSHGDAMAAFMNEWRQAVVRDFNHPSIIGWCPLNERAHEHDEPPMIPTNLYHLNKTLDPTRLAIDTSGYIHHDGFASDLYDVHNYATPADLRAHAEKMIANDWPNVFRNFPFEPAYDGTMPYFASEIGGIWWNPRADNSVNNWGYHGRPTTVEDYLTRYEQTIAAFHATPNLCGWCYTQLTDVEQETNGLYYYDRSPKFSLAEYDRIRRANISNHA
jgi:beta-galactosidase/beta-glucuronidase